MTEVAVHEALGEVLSPSQASTYLACPAKWYFRYLVGLTEPTTGALALGKAFHGTLARNFRQKMSTGSGMEAEELRESSQRSGLWQLPTLHCATMKMRMSLPRLARFLSQLT